MTSTSSVAQIKKQTRNPQHGKPCVKCGACERTPKGACRACVNRLGRAYRAANPEKVKARTAAYYAANKEKVDARMQAYRAANPAKAKESAAAYYAAHRDWRRVTNAAWYATNKDKKKAVNAARRAATKDKQRIYKAAYYEANRERVNARNTAWKTANPEARRIHSQNRRAKERAAGGVLSKGLASRLFKLQRGKCACCKRPLGNDFQLDHIMPLALGGLNIDGNIQLLRRVCNLQKNARHPVDFMQSRGALL